MSRVTLRASVGENKSSVGRSFSGRARVSFLMKAPWRFVQCSHRHSCGHWHGLCAEIGWLESRECRFVEVTSLPLAFEQCIHEIRSVRSCTVCDREEHSHFGRAVTRKIASREAAWENMACYYPRHTNPTWLSHLQVNAEIGCPLQLIYACYQLSSHVLSLVLLSQYR